MALLRRLIIILDILISALNILFILLLRINSFMNIEFHECTIKSFILPVMKGTCESIANRRGILLARARPSVKLKDEKCIKPGCFIFQRPIFLSPTCAPLSFLLAPGFVPLWVTTACGHSMESVNRPLGPAKRVSEDYQRMLGHWENF